MDSHSFFCALFMGSMSVGSTHSGAMTEHLGKHQPWDHGKTLHKLASTWFSYKVEGQNLVKLRPGLLEFMIIYPDTVPNTEKNGSGRELPSGQRSDAIFYTSSADKSIGRCVFRTTLIFK